MAAVGLPPTPEAVLRRIEWKVIRRLDGRLQGDFRTLLHGSGVDVADLREYEPGDDVRHIDWNVTARTEIPHVRTFLEDRALTPGSSSIGLRRWPSVPRIARRAWCSSSWLPPWRGC